jgi:ornithine lipid ester-linked acyl 2-hydroxylase
MPSGGVHTINLTWPTIRRELENVLAMRAGLPAIQELSPLQYTIGREKAWKVYALYAYGTWFKRNCRSCPETTRLLKEIPDLKFAFFSVLESGAHLSAQAACR